MRKVAILFVLLVGLNHFSFGQLLPVNPYPQCNTNSTYYVVNLSGTPDSVWYSPNLSRNSQCCGVPQNTQCITFEVTLDTAAVAIELDMVTGAIAYGSEYYFVNCGNQTPVGKPVCLTGVGPHIVTFCKPGNNANIYRIKSISKPLPLQDVSVRKGCSAKLEAIGFEQNTVSWTSVFPGTQGQYNGYLSCNTNCLEPVVTPDSNAPSYVDYEITGFPLASFCGFLLQVKDTVRVFIYDSLKVSANPNPASFCNIGPGSGVMLTATGIGGDGNYTYYWKNSGGTVLATGSTYFATTPTTYTLEVRDGLYNSNSCPGYQISIPVTQGQIPIVNAGADQLKCANNPLVYLNGNIQNSNTGIWASTGSGVFNPGPSFLNASYMPSINDISNGSVSLILTSTGSGGGCTNKSDTLLVTIMDTIDVSLGNVSLACTGDSVSLTPTINGGNAPYVYSWNTGETSSSINVLQGVYSVYVTDVNGCVSKTATSVVIEPSPLTLSFSTTLDNGTCNGSATAIITGGVSPYSYLWMPSGKVTATATNLCYGIHTVSVTDANGCVITGSVVVNNLACNGFSLSVTNTNIACYGGIGDMGTYAAAVPSGGLAPYNYLWQPGGQTTDTIKYLGVGTYTVTVIDANGCIQTGTATITQPSKLYNVITSTNVTTQGGNDGSATVNPFGGTPVYNFLWSNGSTNQTASNLFAGTYSVVVTDFNNCTAIDSVTILEPPCPNLIVDIAVNHVTCAGSSTGSAVALPSFGLPPYTFLWSTGSTSSFVTNLSAGNYWVQVTDNRNCITLKTFTITAPSPLSIGLSPKHVTCFGYLNGTIELTVLGGTFPYQFSWSNGSNAEDLIGLDTGLYAVVVTDANGCQMGGNTTILQPTLLTASSFKNDVSCFGLSDGNIDVSVAGGMPPYNYLWNTGATTQDLLNIPSGQYTLQITDLNACTANIMELVKQPDSLQVAAFVTSNFNGYGVACFGSSNGSAGSVTIGGTEPYSYLWSNGSTMDTLTNVGSGTYLLTVTDVNGCEDTTSITITSPTKLNVSAWVTSNYNGQTISCFGNADGSADVVVSDGTQPYSYLWSNGTTLDTLTGVLTGTYIVLVADANNCVDSASVVITQPDSLVAIATITSNYNGKNISCYGFKDGSANVTVIGGTQAYSYSWSNGATTPAINSLDTGLFKVIVTDVNGCIDSSFIVLTQPDTLTITATITSNYNGQHISCFGLSDGSVSTLTLGGTLAYTYLWNNGSTQSSLNAIGAGTYLVTVTDANGCADTSSVTLTQPDSLVASAIITSNYNGQHISCYGSNNGSANSSAVGGTGGYTYLWNNNATTPALSNISAGVYIVTITDVNGCSDTASINITQPDSLFIVASVSNITCNGVDSGSIDITVTGGTLPYNYLWSTSATTEDLSGLLAGTYSVIVTDLNGCVKSDSYTIVWSSNLTVSTEVYNALCFESYTGGINLSISQGKEPYQYLWSNGATTEDLLQINAGKYFVLVTDANNCTFSDTFTVGEPDSLSIDANISSYFNQFNISATGASDGFIEITVTGGTPSYTYVWSNGETKEDLFNLYAGAYTLTVTDSKGCILARTFTLTEPNILEMPTGFTPNADGSNDYFVIKGIEAYPDNVLTIFNRWGNQVYSISGYANQWNGVNNNGKPLPDGTYFAILKINGEDITLTGYIDLRR
ncbi:MAG: gliding motility-associated C-terminal domain-containing protein [Flavobacteriales bacterium]|nr:gliding motility-associated C-terminal domain-containing protein [Flavobacteriales bacterium]